MKKSTAQFGFTLVELLVAMAVFSVIIAAIYTAFEAHNRIAAKQEETTAMQQELLALITQIAEDLRMCGYAPIGANTADFGFRHLDGANRRTAVNAIYCTLDGNGNGTLDESGPGSSVDHMGYAININANGTSNGPNDLHVVRKYTAENEDDPWQPAATNISDLRFTYYDAKGDEIEDPGKNNKLNEIRSVEINATAVPSPQRAGLNIGNRTMSTRIYCRNLGLQD